MESPPVPYRDRRTAGRWLARAVKAQVHLDDPVVLALPRGGVPVAAEVATALQAPLDVLLVRKLGVPGHRELGVGAVGEGGVVVRDDDRIRRLGIAPQALSQVEAEEQAELDRRLARYRGERAPVALAGRDVVLVDDGVATGVTARAAVQVLRQRGARRVVVAVPVGAAAGVRDLRRLADAVVCPATVEGGFAVGAFYEDFGQLSDAEVVRILGQAHDDALADTED